MSIVRELQEKRASIAKQAQAELTKASQEGREFSAEEQAKFDRAMADVDSLAKQIQNFEKLAGVESKVETADFGRKVVANSEATKEEVHFSADPKYNKAFDLYMRGKNAKAMQTFDLTIGGGSDGGYIVGVEYQNALVQKMNEASIMRGLANVISTNSDRVIPFEAAPVQAYLVEEATAFTQSDPGFGQIKLGAYKLGCFTKASVELLNDSLFPLAGEIARQFGRAWGELSDKLFLTGTGTNQPKGLFTATTNVVTSGTASLTFDDYISAYYALKSPYRVNATWIANDTTIAATRKIKDTSGQYIWTPSVQEGQPDRILGRPVATSPFVPAIAASAKAVAFADCRYYTVLDRQGARIQVLDQPWAVNGMVGYIGFIRTDGNLLLNEASVVLQMKA